MTPLPGSNGVQPVTTLCPFAVELSALADKAEYVIRECPDPELRDSALLLAAARRVARLNYVLANGSNG